MLAPDIPSFLEISPSFIPATVIRAGSSSWKLRGTSSSFAFNIALYITSLSIIGSPSSVNPTAPYSLRAFISTNFSPLNPLVIAHACKTFIGDNLAFSFIYSKVSLLSTIGLVFAIQTTVVNPPLAADIEPVCISSLWVNPGSLKWTWTSISPGETMQLLASITFLYSFVGSNFPIFKILSPLIIISNTSSLLLFGSITLPFFISIIFYILPLNINI